MLWRAREDAQPQHNTNPLVCEMHITRLRSTRRTPQRLLNPPHSSAVATVTVHCVACTCQNHCTCVCRSNHCKGLFRLSTLTTAQRTIPLQSSEGARMCACRKHQAFANSLVNHRGCLPAKFSPRRPPAHQDIKFDSPTGRHVAHSRSMTSSTPRRSTTARPFTYLRPHACGVQGHHQSPGPQE